MKQNSPLIFFFKYLQNEKRYDFALLWHLVITYFERLCQISPENFDWLASYCDFVRGVPKNSKKNFFLEQLFLQNIPSILYVAVVNMIFFFWNHIFLLAFENKYITIGNFVGFFIRKCGIYFSFLIYYVKQFASIYLFFLSIIKSVIHFHS